MTRDKELEKCVDKGTALLIEEILDCMQEYLNARRSGRDKFNYRGSFLDLNIGLEKARTEYYSNVANLSSDFNRNKVSELRLRYLEFEEAIAEMDGREI